MILIRNVHSFDLDLLFEQIYVFLLSVNDFSHFWSTLASDTHNNSAAKRNLDMLIDLNHVFVIQEMALTSFCVDSAPGCVCLVTQAGFVSSRR